MSILTSNTFSFWLILLICKVFSYSKEIKPFLLCMLPIFFQFAVVPFSFRSSCFLTHIFKKLPFCLRYFQWRFFHLKSDYSWTPQHALWLLIRTGAIIYWKFTICEALCNHFLCIFYLIHSLLWGKHADHRGLFQHSPLTPTWLHTHMHMPIQCVPIGI